MLGMMNKTCTDCNQEKNICDFGKDKTGKYGVKSKCKVCCNKKSQEWRSQNPDYFQKWIENNKDSHNQNTKSWVENNKDKVKEAQKRFRKKEAKNTPHKIKWKSLLRTTLVTLQQEKNDKTHVLLGYSPQQLKECLEHQGIDWNKHQVDHKIPITWFKSETPVSIVNDLRNLQPLDSKSNQSKGNKYADKVSKEYFNIVKQWILPEKINNIYYG